MGATSSPSRATIAHAPDWNALRRAALALACGAACSPIVWIGAHAFAPWVIGVGALCGVAYGSAFTYRRGASLDSAFTAAALAVPIWMMVELFGLPLGQGHMPAWTATEVRAAFPALVGWMLFGAALGGVIQVAGRFATFNTTIVPGKTVEPAAPTRVVILGGGFAGMTMAMKMEQALQADRTIAITLVSDANALLFTPMLAEVAGSSIEPTHISCPLRTNLHRTNVMHARASAVDLERHVVALSDGTGDAEPRELEYDHLVLALGAVSNFFGRDDIERIALDFKSLPDAIRIRNRVIAMFERADREPDENTRKRLLTFVVAGGGFAGIELAGALNDFARGISADYTRLDPDHIRVVVVHGRDRILPELSESLASFALAKMRDRGVAFELGAHVSDATADTVTIDKDRTIAASTLIWTAGTVPNPLVGTLAVERDKRGAVIVDSHLAVPSRAGVWGLGDCAAVPDRSAEGATYPPTAQHALREAAVAARNVVASIRAQPLKPFSFDSLGSLCVIGYQTACAEIRPPFMKRKLHFSGTFAWFLWRGIYLAKLPGFERKVRAFIDWNTELFFPRDTVETMEG